MPRIEWKGIIKNPSDYQKGFLANNAKKLNTPKTLNEMMIKALPFVMPSILIIFIVMFLKTTYAGRPVVAPAAVILGFAVSIVALLIHEFLHAIVYPSKATVVIGVVPKQFAAVALASYPLKRSRFILMCLLPYLLGIIPILLFCVSPAADLGINGFLFGLSIMGLTSPYVDSYNVYQVLRQTSKSDSIQFYGDELYAISENS
ncbi:MAG: DUF3267 domain-containing protein [Eubacterium sp.]|nr:DUF3267 domain-containing protein [Eubacterium sp.]